MKRDINVLSVLAGIGLLIALAPQMAQAQVPGQIPIQGYLTDAEGEPYDAEVAITFTIYDAATGGTELFTERQTIIVDRGVFTTYLGTVEDLDLSIFRDNGGLYLGLQVGADSEASPRLRFAAVPWAAYADDAASFGGVAASELPTVVEEWAREACLDTEEELTALLDDNYANPAWDSITGIPADIADGDDGFTTEDELTALLDDNYANPAWDSLTGVPAGFADGTDDGFTTEDELTDLLDDNYANPAWGDIVGVPAGLADGDDDTTYSAGAGLSLDGTTFSVEFDGDGEADTAARSDAVELLRAEMEEMLSEYQRIPNGALYRWNVFSTYAEWIGGGWVMDNRNEMFGGVHPSQWTDGSYRAVHMSSNPAVLRTLFTNRGNGGNNAMIWSEIYWQYSSTNGRVVVALFRIENTTGSSINWTPYFYYSSFGGWSEYAGVAINGSEVWHSGGTDSGTSNAASVTITIPPRRISTIIFTSPSSRAYSNHDGMYIRFCGLGFYNNSLRLPEGLRYVDDLDTLTDPLW